MTEFFSRVFNNARYFIAFVISLGLIILFLWRLINPESFHEAINGFMQEMFIVFRFILVLALVLWGFKIMIFGNKKSGGNKHG